jgi:hypothetical protein
LAPNHRLNRRKKEEIKMESSDKFRRSERQTKNISIKKQARQKVLELCKKMDKIGNDYINKGFLKPQDQNLIEKSCVAKIYEFANNTAQVEGKYDAASMTHAEMDALTQYIKGKEYFGQISSIEITSPPCKECAFVLQLHNLLINVRTTGEIHKHFTGSWKWPEELKEKKRFSTKAWQELLSYYKGSGLEEDEVLQDVVLVIQKQTEFV